MFGRHRTHDVTCPHCGAAQAEPRGVISTYCRSCGMHFSATAPKRPAKPVVIVRQPTRVGRVSCFSCGHSQRVHAGVPEAPCRSCGAMMRYADVRIDGHSTRMVETHGRVFVGRKGFLNSTRVVCAGAHVEGRISGRIECGGLLRMGNSYACRAQIHAGSFLVDRGAQLHFAYTVYIGDGIIRGRVEGDIVCSGTLRITKQGAVIGDIDARALMVDRGGIYSGDVRVTPERRSDAPRREERKRDMPDHGGWLPGFAVSAT